MIKEENGVRIHVVDHNSSVSYSTSAGALGDVLELTLYDIPEDIGRFRLEDKVRFLGRDYPILKVVTEQSSERSVIEVDLTLRLTEKFI
jgi:hypothetical protein